MKWKNIAAGSLATVLIATALVVAGMMIAPSESIASAPVSVTALTEVTQVGLKITGVALEYEKDLGVGELDPDAFRVETRLSSEQSGKDLGDTARTVTAAYTSSEPVFQSVATAGRFITIELAADDERSEAIWFDGEFTSLLNLQKALTVRQVADIHLPGGKMAADPGASYQSTASIRLIADEYEVDVLHSENGIDMPYRLFKSDVNEQVPLVVTLHGHAESGVNNVAQIVGNQVSVAFADPARQASRPAYVLSPQSARGAPGGDDGVGWWAPEWQAAVIELIEKTIAENPNIDPDRVYLTGLSMGSFGSWEILVENRDLFAAAVLVCGAGDEAAAIAELSDLPIWALHSVDDFVVEFDSPGSDYRIFKHFADAGLPVVWSEWAGDAPQHEQEAAARATVTAAEARDAIHIFTSFPAGTTPVTSHHSWVPTYRNPVILDWLFDQDRAAS